MSTTSPIEHSELISLSDIPNHARGWADYERSVTDIAARLTQHPVKVNGLHQGLGNCPDWVSADCRKGWSAFVRHIELFAGDQRVLIARTFTHPDGDVVAKLLELGDAPLANLLFEDPSNQRSMPHYVRAGSWFGRAVHWQISGCTDRILLMELFDPDFVQAYTPSDGENR